MSNKTFQTSQSDQASNLGFKQTEVLNNENMGTAEYEIEASNEVLGSQETSWDSAMDWFDGLFDADVTDNSKAKTKTENKNNSSAWSGDNIGGTLKGVGAVTSALASIWSISEQSDFNDKLLKREDDRIAKNELTDKKRQEVYEAVYG